MVKTAVILNDYGFGANAPSQIAIDSALALAKAGVLVLYFCAVGPVDGRLCTHPGVRVVCTGQPPLLTAGAKAALRGLWNAKAARLLRRALAGLAPRETVVHLHLWAKALSPSVLAAAARFGAPVFLTAHEYYTVCPNGGLLHYPKGQICRERPMSPRCVLAGCDRRGPLQKLWRVARQVVQNRALGRVGKLTVLAPSLLSRAVLQRHLPGKSIVYLPNFVRALPGARAGIPFEQNRPYLFIGRLEPEKGVELFCRALATLGLPGIAVGGAPTPAQEARLCERWPGVRFTGALGWEAIAPVLAGCRALVFPSLWHEGMGLVPFEVQKNYAMPCIVADQSAPRQLVRQGETGLLFPTGDLEGLKSALQAMEDDALVAAMRRNIAARDFGDYEQARHTSALLRLYQSAAEGEAGHACD